MEQNSLRRKRFEVVAARRVQGVLDYLDRLSNCANRANYEYSSEDVRKMFSTIRERVKAIEGTFDKELNKSDKNKFKFQQLIVQNFQGSTHDYAGAYAALTLTKKATLITVDKEFNQIIGEANLR